MGLWRQDAAELTKLELERKLKTRSPNHWSLQRPNIEAFLANYRDLEQLDTQTPAQLYETIVDRRVKSEQDSATTGRVVGTLIPDYDEMNADEISTRLDGLSVEDLRAVRNYEERNKSRDVLLEQLDHKIRASS